MDQKTTTTKPNALFIHALKEKKKWAILTSAVLIVTVMILPILMDVSLNEGFLAFGIFEISIIVIVCTLMDFNYLHDARKFGYYKSKPYREKNRMHGILISNLIFALVFFLALFIIGLVSGVNNLDELFIVPAAWLIVALGHVALSSYLSGNTIIAALSAAFTFGLPLMIVGVIYYAMNIVSNMAIGFNVSIIMTFIIEHVIKLELIYFVQFFNDFTWLYFLVLAGQVGILYLATLWAMKHRKNERIGEHIVYRGYKYFIAMMFSVMTPFLFVNIWDSDGYVEMLIAFVILGALTYYIALVILDKSFKIKQVAVKVLAVFMCAFVVIIVVAGGILSLVANDVPEAEDIKAVFITEYQDVFVGSKNLKFVPVNSLTYEDIGKYGLPTYTSSESIDLIIDLHEEILEDRAFNYKTIHMLYFLKDGSTVKRYYQLDQRSGNINEDLATIMSALIKTPDNSRMRYPYFFDQNFKKHMRNLQVKYYHGQKDGEQVIPNELEDLLVDALRKDIEVFMLDLEDTDYNIGYNNNYNYFPFATLEKDGVVYDSIYMEFYFGNTRFKSFDIPANFNHTREFFETFIK